MLKQELMDMFARYQFDRQVFHDLMHHKVHEVLLVATIYDSYILEQEGPLTERIFGEYYQLSLSNAPRITSVNTSKAALKKISKKKYDMVILTMRIDEISPFVLSHNIKELAPDLPILLLLNDNSEISCLRYRDKQLSDIERVFVWNSDPKTFLAMIKYVEDKLNVDNDVEVGMVRVILLVEDSVRYYSRYLPVLYNEIIRLTQKLINEEHDDAKKLLRMRARPKILLASNYEQAIALFEKYKDYLLCLISDVKFPRGNCLDEHAGFKLIQYAKEQIIDLPALLQSSEKENEKKAQAIKAHFIDKNSETLATGLTEFVLKNLGFGDFCFRLESEEQTEYRARNLAEFEKILVEVPGESILYHARRNHFSAWLMARGEITIAQKVYKVKADDFEHADALRGYLIKVFRDVHYQNTKGKVIDFDRDLIGKTGRILKLSEGSLGGKGRGIAFLNTLLHNLDLKQITSKAVIKIPQTVIIGTEEFEEFRAGHLGDYSQEIDYRQLKQKFSQGQLSPALIEKLRILLQQMTTPLAVRSSGLFEDSLSQPFSGIYDTFLLPNNHPDLEVRLEQLLQAIKLVYACIYSESARSYFEAIDYKGEEEKMAVVLQQVVGNHIGDRFYPHISGVAQSYNYYPYSYLQPEDGIAAVALGLGQYVVEGEKAYTFSPRHPRVDIYGPEDLLKKSQTHFYGIDMTKMQVNLTAGEDATLLKYNLEQAEQDGSLQHVASVWDVANNRVQPGLHATGPRIINFQYVLKYQSFPLAKILDFLLGLITQCMGTPVEIEFAVNLDNSNGPPTFYVLQIKHLLHNIEKTRIDIETITPEDLLVFSDKGIGHGHSEAVRDIVYVDPERFDKTKTKEMVTEVTALNTVLKQQQRKYLLIGPGRWGTRDRWLGIPVKWADISYAQAIVEYGLENFQVDTSLGSHFFHNITSLNIGYFSVPFAAGKSFIDWQWLKRQTEASRRDYLVHVQLSQPLRLVMNGRKRISVIFKPGR